MPLTDARARPRSRTRRGRRQIAAESDTDPDLTMADGYAVQSELGSPERACAR
jgi:2-keto-4-pentenoate hydratase